MSLVAISDLHVRHGENRAFTEALRPESDDDWLLVAGDVAETADDILWAMELLSKRFSTVVWVPGNHDLWTVPTDPVRLRGLARYEYLVRALRDLGVHTPEDPYPVWEGPDGPVVVAPLFLLYDHTFRPEGTRTKEEALAVAHDAGVVCTDEYLLHPDPYPGRDAWCRARLDYTRGRLDALPQGAPTVLVNHWPMVREPTRVLRYPEFAQWCGTEETADWHVRYRARAVVYGHLHIPRTIVVDGVPHIEVSLGYPREWGPRPAPPEGPRRVLPLPR
ncbi:metallophosphoesterase [Nocardiopsis sp. EMB25]|uniref:metallophosphoesterase family protein n=1 Tax=Nocardiopsis TaxID=2013 RepID=UPI00034D0706|nr:MULTISPECIES: metallophosphoesterase [Nocardiopsis]MCY9784175.1 metallophosphoesterase [Nocardiopsis sp. EMB25]